jgi:hypothetical protein
MFKTPTGKRISSFLQVCLLAAATSGACAAATPVRPPTPTPSAVVTVADAQYCYERVRRLEVDRLPPSYLVLDLKLKVTYRNPGPRPLIIPVEHERAVYTALKPGVMNIFKEVDPFDSSMKMMKELPPKVDPHNPFATSNDVFALVPANGQLVASMAEEIAIPVNHKTLIRRDPDLRGRKLYLRLSLLHQELSPELEADLSDRWTPIGVPWTGELLTNVVTIDVPQTPPPAGTCRDGQPNTRF